MTTEKIAQLFDGSLDEGEAKKVLDALEQDPALRDRFTLYGLTGDVLRGNSTPDDGFTQRILQRMEKGGVQMEAGFDPLID
ncbi:MAG TPA: sigma-E factor negative regulatory protein [Burkholderiales bacterium]|nr:sigma-E factor negative regulatory protein [Burkholderiales bacterium]